MKYMGSKARIKKEILPIILKDRKINQYYVEPFSGGMNMIDEVTGNRIANDVQQYLIAMWRGLLSGEKYPTCINKELYNSARDVYNGKENKLDLSNDLIGWIGFMGSANGRFFDGGYSGKSKTKLGTERDYIKEAISNINKQIEKLDGVELFDLDYLDLPIPNNSIIYCDPPYKGTKQYSLSNYFNHNDFWDWCRNMKSKGHTIFISEYSAPEDFICIWEKEIKSSLSANGKTGCSKISTEKLFTLK